jgi:hypothetical protein
MEKWGLLGQVALKFGLPSNTGGMEDRDWQDETDTSKLTDSSSHDNYTRGAVLIDALVGASLPIAGIILLKAYVGYSYMFFCWYGQDGYGERPQVTTRYYFSGAVINYSQVWNIITGGVSVSYHFLNMFSVGLGFKAGKLASFLAQDDHLPNDKQFTDSVDSMFSTSGGILLEPAFEFTFAPNPVLAIALNANYRFITRFHAVSFARATGPYSYVQTSAPAGNTGASYEALDVGLALTLRF